MSELALTQRNWLWIFGALITSVALVGVIWPPYSSVLALAAVFGAILLIAKPEIAFALFFAVETLFSEDILLATEKLYPTLYYIPLPGIGINVFEVALLLLIAATVLHRKGRLAATPLDPSLFLFAAACVLGYATCVVLYGDPARVFEPRRLLHFFCAYFLTINLIRDKKALQLFITIYLVAITCKAMQGVYLYLLGEGLLIKWRIRAIFTGWGDSLNFVTFLLILGTFILDRTSLPYRRWYLALTPVVLFSFMFSYKRAYYVALLAGLFMMALLLKGKARVRLFALGVAGFVVLLGLIVAMGQWQAVQMRVESILNPSRESSANYRLIEWQNAMISIKKNPVFGIGLGGVMPMEIWLSRTNLLGVHNTYLWVAVKLGAIGLFCYFLVLSCFGLHLFRQGSRLNDPYLRTLARAFLCVLIAFMAAQMFAPMFQQMRTSAWFGILLGLGMMLPYIDKQKDPERSFRASDTS